MAMFSLELMHLTPIIINSGFFLYVQPRKCFFSSVIQFMHNSAVMLNYFKSVMLFLLIMRFQVSLLVAQLEPFN